MRPLTVTLAATIVFAVVLSNALGQIEPKATPSILVATPRHGERIVLRSHPGGRALAVVPRRTEFGSPVKLGVAVTRGNWIAVISERLPNAVLGWLPRKRVTVLRIAWSIDVSRARHLLELRHGD